ncbi:hypothetical protein M407DRAFT_26364 [Tulasnella calospora MUT 4182]|uniref:Protein kinase domain-containing protein n=1 Tax=Tulasnella calospora MUT 4182 TaxID=1051891 RepID=A0A0C3Q574_9AGAM|nr:hypothetical protein M407DRAFT_26364 [Tulasnella calospora MUT 4182]
MSGSTNQKEEPCRSTSAQESVIDEIGDAMKRLRISPRKVLDSLSHLRIDRARIMPIEGHAPKAGGNADVEAAVLTPTQWECDTVEWVAVKKLRFDEDTDDDRTLAPLAHEVDLLNKLSHENVVKILGFVENAGEGVGWMVFAWERNGNLREFIRSEKWELPERISLINDVAGGLGYLHGRNPEICHGDLKSLNILVNSDNRAVITDLGSARALGLVEEEALKGARAARTTTTSRPDAMRAKNTEVLTAEIDPSGEFITMTGPAWTVRWAAPELLEGDLPGLASDIWALGWICWEAVTGNFPFDKENDVVVALRVTKGDLPTIEDDHQLKQIKALCSLMRECWKLDTSERPTAQRCHQLVTWMDQAVPSSRDGSSSSVTRSSGLLQALGLVQMRNDMYTEAQAYFEQSLKVAESVGDEMGCAGAFIAIADTFNFREEYSKAEELYIQAREVFSRIGHQRGFAESVNRLGNVYRIRNEYSKAEESYIQARDISFETGYVVGFAESVKNLGDVYCRRSEYPKAEESYIQAREIYSQLGYQHGFAESVKSLGDVYRLRNEYSKAEESYIQARDVYSQFGHQTGFAESVKGLGDVYCIRSEYPKAEELYIQAREIYSQVGQQLGFAQSVSGLGDVYLMRSEYSKAEESYLQAREIYSQIGDQLSFAQSVSRLGELYLTRKEYPKAEESYIQARDMYSQFGDQICFAQSVKSLGDVYFRQSEYPKAEESYIQAREIFSQIGNLLGSAQSFEGMGRVHLARGEYAKAEESYTEARQIYQQIGDMHSLATISWYLGWLYREQAQYGAAERWVREASTISSGLGQTNEVEECDKFLEEIHRLME